MKTEFTRPIDWIDSLCPLACKDSRQKRKASESLKSKPIWLSLRPNGRSAYGAESSYENIEASPARQVLKTLTRLYDYKRQLGSPPSSNNVLYCQVVWRKGTSICRDLTSQSWWIMLRMQKIVSIILTAPSGLHSPVCTVVMEISADGMTLSYVAMIVESMPLSETKKIFPSNVK